MSYWNLESAIKEVIQNEVCKGLGIQTSWIGDPATSVFGIQIDLLWNNAVVRSTIVDFIGKTFD